MQINEFIAGLLKDKDLLVAPAPHYHIGALDKVDYEMSQKVINALDSQEQRKLLEIAERMLLAAERDIKDEKQHPQVMKIIREAIVFWKEIKEEIRAVFTRRLMQKLSECDPVDTEFLVPCGISRMEANSFIHLYNVEELQIFAGQVRTAKTKAYRVLHKKYVENGLDMEHCRREKMLWQYLNAVLRIVKAKMD